MARTIVFCADGTWNGPGSNPTPGNDGDAATPQETQTKDNVTNVYNLFLNLSGDLTPETRGLVGEAEKVFKDSSGVVSQVSKYLHGVGDSSNPIMKVLGGVFGVGLVARIVRGYTFISRNYRAGDSIYIVGFSRGAYTARALAGMIASVGLLNPDAYDPDDREQAYRLGIAAWAQSKQVVFTRNPVSSLLTKLAGFAEQIMARQLKPGDLIPDVSIRSVAVWDTVGSMGIPAYVKHERLDLFTFVDLKLSQKVQQGFHAMALDERRLDFPVTRWDPDPRVQQMWFVGAHADVGGGYPLKECGLSDIALDWMTRNLAGAGVRFVDPMAYSPDVTRVAQDFHKPWREPPFNIGPQPRSPLQDDLFHSSVQQHWSLCPPYQGEWPTASGFKFALPITQTALEPPSLVT
jgi:hypothetical protein